MDAVSNRRTLLKVMTGAAAAGFVAGSMLAVWVVAREESPLVLDDYGLLPTAWPLMLLAGTAFALAAGLTAILIYFIVRQYAAFSARKVLNSSK